MSLSLPPASPAGEAGPSPGIGRRCRWAPGPGAGPRPLALLPLLAVAALLLAAEQSLAGQEPVSDRCAPKECARTIDSARAWQIGPALAGYGRIESGGHREGAAVWVTERVAGAVAELLRTEGRLTEAEARALRRRLRANASGRHAVLWAPLRGGEANCAPGMYERIYARAVDGARLVAEGSTGTVQSPVADVAPERVRLPDRSWARGLRDAWLLRFPRTDSAGRPLLTPETKRVELRVPWTTRTAEIRFEVEKLPAGGIDEL